MNCAGPAIPGYSAKTAEYIGYQLLQKTLVQAEIQRCISAKLRPKLRDSTKPQPQNLIKLEIQSEIQRCIKERQAAIRAGYSVKTANEQGARLLTNGNIPGDGGTAGARQRRKVLTFFPLRGVN